MADIAVVTGASSGLGVKFLEADKYPQMDGDITTDLRIAPNDVVGAIGDIVKNYAASMHFSQSDFQEVIHLV